jgi:hypothetical protein
MAGNINIPALDVMRAHLSDIHVARITGRGIPLIMFHPLTSSSFFGEFFTIVNEYVISLRLLSFFVSISQLNVGISGSAPQLTRVNGERQSQEPATPA